MVSPVLVVRMWPFMETGQGKGEESDWQLLVLSPVKVTKTFDI